MNRTRKRSKKTNFLTEVRRQVAWLPQLNRKFFTIETPKIKWKVWPTTTYSDAGPPDDYATIGIECVYENNTSTLWACDAEITVELFEICDGVSTEKTMDCSFNNCSTYLNLGTFSYLKLGTFSKANKSYYRGFCKIKVTIGVKSMTEGDHLPICDFLIPRNNDSEITIRVGCYKLYADKNGFLCFSSVIREALSDGRNEIEIKGVDFEYFVHFLRILNRQEQQITNKNYEPLLKLAKEFDVQFLVCDCEDWYISVNTIPFREKLRYAERNRLPKLQMEVLNKMTIVEAETLFGFSMLSAQAILQKFADSEPPSKKWCNINRLLEKEIDPKEVREFRADRRRRN